MLRAILSKNLSPNQIELYLKFKNFSIQRKLFFFKNIISDFFFFIDRFIDHKLYLFFPDIEVKPHCAHNSFPRNPKKIPFKLHCKFADNLKKGNILPFPNWPWLAR